MDTPRAPHQLIDPGLPPVGGVLPLVGQVVSPAGLVRALVSQAIPLAGHAVRPAAGVPAGIAVRGFWLWILACWPHVSEDARLPRPSR